MSRRNIENTVKSRFAQTGQAKQTHEKINQYQDKIKQLEAELNKESKDKFSVAISKIRPSDQCRQTFSSDAVAKRVVSLKKEGQVSPIVLIPQEKSNSYWIENGELTWRAALKLVEQGHSEWEFLDGVLSKIKEGADIHRRTLIHHLHSESLNSLDRAVAVIREAQRQTGLEQEQVVKKFNKLLNRVRKLSNWSQLLSSISFQGIEKYKKELDELDLSEDLWHLLSVLSDLQIEPTSFITNDLRMLAIADELKLAIRTQDLPCHQAKVLNAIYQSGKLICEEDKAQKIRKDTLERVLSNKLSVKATKELVDNILAENGRESIEPLDNINLAEEYKNAKNSIQKLPIKNLKPRQLQSLKKTLEKKLEQINRNLKTKD